MSAKHECIVAIIYTVHPNKINIKDVLSTDMLFQTSRCYNVKHLCFVFHLFLIFSSLAPYFCFMPCFFCHMHPGDVHSRCPVAHPDSQTAAVRRSAALIRYSFPSMTSSEETQLTPGGAVT